MIEFNVDPQLIITLLVGTVLPLLVGLVTKVTTSGGVKAVLLAALSLASSLLTELGVAIANGVPYDLGAGLLVALPTFLVAVGLHFGLWKPVGAAEAAQKAFTSSTS